jgi:hypothetical protein
VAFQCQEAEYFTPAPPLTFHSHLLGKLTAFAAVERLSEKELQDLLWEQKRLSRTEHCITLRRRFTDPEYPQKFDAAFRRLTGDLNSARVQ